MVSKTNADKAADEHGGSDRQNPHQIFTQTVFHESEVDDAENPCDADAGVVDADTKQSKNVDRTQCGQDKRTTPQCVANELKP